MQPGKKQETLICEQWVHDLYWNVQVLSGKDCMCVHAQFEKSIAECCVLEINYRGLLTSR